MKKVLLTMLMLLAVFSIHAQKTYVLLLGVNNYGTGENNLSFPVKDAKELKQIFDKQGMTVAMLTSKYVTKENIDKKLDAIIKLARPQDKIIFFFSGHGTPGAFCCYGFNLYRYSDLANKLSQARTSNIFCFIDACHSGSAQFATNEQTGLGSVNPVFCIACRPQEYSYEKFLVDNGVFTQALTKGLRGKADYNKDKKITLLELFKYAHADVIQKTKDNQHPQLVGSQNLYNTVIAKW